MPASCRRLPNVAEVLWFNAFDWTEWSANFLAAAYTEAILAIPIAVSVERTFLSHLPNSQGTEDTTHRCSQMTREGIEPPAKLARHFPSRDRNSSLLISCPSCPRFRSERLVASGLRSDIDNRCSANREQANKNQHQKDRRPRRHYRKDIE